MIKPIGSGNYDTYKQLMYLKSHLVDTTINCNMRVTVYVKQNLIVANVMVILKFKIQKQIGGEY